jgi:hypothetical protein
VDWELPKGSLPALDASSVLVNTLSSATLCNTVVQIASLLLIAVLLYNFLIPVHAVTGTVFFLYSFVQCCATD